MKLTDKCKQDFEKWYTKDISDDFIEQVSKAELSKEDTLTLFYTLLKDSMQYGVLVDFFDSVNIYIDSICINENDFTCQIWNRKSKKALFNGNIFKTRQEAREQAIIKANEIYNGFNKKNNKSNICT